MKTLRTVEVQTERLTALSMELDTVDQEFDTVQALPPDTSLEERVRLQEAALSSVRKQLLHLRRSINKLLGDNAASALPDIIVGSYRAQNNLKLSYAQAQAMYSPGTLAAEFDEVTGTAIASALIKLFSVAGYNCRNWETFVSQHSFSH